MGRLSIYLIIFKYSQSIIKLTMKTLFAFAIILAVSSAVTV